MAVSGLVITLCSDAARRREAMERFGRDRRLVLGDLLGSHLAVSATTDSPREDLALIDELRAVPGVEQVEIVFVGLDEQADGNGAPTRQGALT